jgi:hypothetical protein
MVHLALCFYSKAAAGHILPVRTAERNIIMEWGISWLFTGKKSIIGAACKTSNGIEIRPMCLNQ